jgi:hypothetical protein
MIKSKSKPQFAARKKAFDEVMATYRSAKDVTGGLGAITISDASRGSSNPVRPTLTDFRCDVDRILTRCIAGIILLRFRLSYIEFDSESSIDMEMYAERVMGSMRHNLEQGIGNEFIKRGLYPLHGGKGYFHSVRQPRGAV